MIQRLMSEIKRRVAPQLPYLPFALVATAMLLVVAVAIFRLTAAPDAPFRYTQSEYVAERSIYAPGETLAYTASLTIERAGAVTLVRGWRTADGAGRARLCSGENAPIIVDTPPPFPEDAVGTDIEGIVRVVVPDLPPGSYWLVSSVSKADGGETLTHVAVRVEKECS